MGAWIQVAVGGAIGATLRFGVQAVALRLFGPGFPVGTMTVNVIGSVLIGLLAAQVLGRPELIRIQPLLMTGILGGFTTFSTFSLDTLSIVQRGETGKALAYVTASLMLSLLGVVLGFALGRSA